MGDRAPPTDDLVVAQLRRRGYLRPPLPRASGSHALGGAAALPSEQELRTGIMALQEAYDLIPTGAADQALLAFLDQPYCDVPDPYGPATALLGGSEGGVGWANPAVTYQFMSFSTRLERAEVRAAFEAAFRTWEGVCRLRFSEVEEQGDMRISFGLGHHGDPWPFQGPAGALAHAFYPDWPDRLRGDIHIDDAEAWVVDPQPAGGAMDLHSVVLHEIGHAIGLPHSTVRGSVMWPNYTGVLRRLHDSDIVNIGLIYS